MKYEYNHAINAIVLGYLITLLALALNISAGSKLGIAFAVLTFAVSYFFECARAQGVEVKGVAGLAPTAFCSAAYLNWLVYA